MIWVFLYLLCQFWITLILIGTEFYNQYKNLKNCHIFNSYSIFTVFFISLIPGFNLFMLCFVPFELISLYFGKNLTDLIDSKVKDSLKK